MTNSEIIYEVIKHRRSVRSYTHEPPPKEVLQRLMEVGHWAPSPSNVQSWRFICMTESGLLLALKNLSPGFPKDATSAIVICSDRRDTQRFSGSTRVNLIAEEGAMAAQNMLLMAHAMSYGSCVVASFSEVGVAALLELPDYINPVLIVALGTPDCQPSAPARKALADITYWETYQGG